MIEKWAYFIYDIHSKVIIFYVTIKDIGTHRLIFYLATYDYISS